MEVAVQNSVVGERRLLEHDFRSDRTTEKKGCHRNFNRTAIEEPGRDTSGGMCGSGLVVAAWTRS